MVAGRRRERLAQWLAEELPLRFEDRILAVDPEVAVIWGVVMARSESKGHAMGAMDAFVAATAEAHDLTLVTRNIRDFEHLGISLVDPWQPRPEHLSTHKIGAQHEPQGVNVELTEG